MTFSDFRKGAAVIGMIAGGPDSTVASVRIARYLAAELRLPLHMNKDRTIWEVVRRAHTAIIVNGPMLYVFAGYKERDPGSFAAGLLEISRRTKNIVWVRNDYTILPPASESGAQSSFRKEWSERGLIPHYWSTCEKDWKTTKLSCEVNWNMLTYHPQHNLGRVTEPEKLFYYGAYRDGRVRAFEQFLGKGVVVSCSKTAKAKFARHAGLEVIPPMGQDEFYKTIHRYGLGLYLEDNCSHKSYHSPANRFFEMLSAEIPMVFEPNAVGTFKQFGLEAVERYVVEGRKEARQALRHRQQILKEQRSWRGDYQGALRKQLWHAVDTLRKAI